MKISVTLLMKVSLTLLTKVNLTLLTKASLTLLIKIRLTPLTEISLRVYRMSDVDGDHIELIVYDLGLSKSGVSECMWVGVCERECVCVSVFVWVCV